MMINPIVPDPFNDDNNGGIDPISGSETPEINPPNIHSPTIHPPNSDLPDFELDTNQSEIKPLRREEEIDLPEKNPPEIEPDRVDPMK